jgi:G:T/U-mismatch repair DNA glycosylase
MHPFIGTIFFNGAKAESIYRREVLPTLSEPARSLTLVRLPSTSPAHAGMTFEEKRKAWGRIGRALEENAGQGYYERRSDCRRE